MDTDGNMIPVDNVSATPEFTYALGPPDMATAMKLSASGRLRCVAHSHPQWPAMPSKLDIEGHAFSCSMLIYSCTDDEFKEYSAEFVVAARRGRDIKLIEKGLKKWNLLESRLLEPAE